MDLLAFRFQRRAWDEDELGNYHWTLDPFLSSDQFSRAVTWVCKHCVRMPSPGDLLEIALDLPAEAPCEVIPFPWARTS
jgi:hypothetical protein